MYLNDYMVKQTKKKSSQNNLCNAVCWQLKSQQIRCNSDLGYFASVRIIVNSLTTVRINFNIFFWKNRSTICIQKYAKAMICI